MNHKSMVESSFAAGTAPIDGQRRRVLFCMIGNHVMAIHDTGAYTVMHAADEREAVYWLSSMRPNLHWPERITVYPLSPNHIERFRYGDIL